LVCALPVGQQVGVFGEVPGDWCPKSRCRVLGGLVEMRLKEIVGAVVAEAGRRAG
jgi:hypothetical protein